MRLTIGGVIVNILRIVLTVIFVIDCIGLTVVVLMQEGKQKGLGAISGMGGVAADGIGEARKNGPFISREDLKNRSKVSTAAIEALAEVGALEGMPATDQIELF